MSQVVGRIHHNPDHVEPVRAVLNSVGRALPDDTKLYAAPALHAKAGVSVKGLEWVEYPEGMWGMGKCWQATACISGYRIKDDQIGRKRYSLWLCGLSAKIGTYSTLEAAKAAAQADYDARIRSALSTKLQEPVAFDIDEYQQKRYDNGQPEDPTAYPDWKPDSESAPALAHQPVTAGWQNIDSAPKDGTPILCFTPDYLSAGLNAGFSDASGMDVLWFDEGAWLYNAEPVAFQPTHWQPLPASPNAALKSEGCK